eukprot:6174137-Pleurochrysis_carterae.AAC.5
MTRIRSLRRYTCLTVPRQVVPPALPAQKGAGHMHAAASDLRMQCTLGPSARQRPFHAGEWTGAARCRCKLLLPRAGRLHAPHRKTAAFGTQHVLLAAQCQPSAHASQVANMSLA